MDLSLTISISNHAGKASGGAESPVPAVTAPAAFAAGSWSLADAPSAGGDTLSLAISALPDNGGAAITALQYRIGTGAAVSLAGTGTGTRTITVPALATASIQVRAVNSAGAGAWSAAKSATPTATAATTAPAAFAAADWSLADAPSAGGDTLSLAISALPDNGGAAITALQYRIGTGAAVTLAGTGPGTWAVTVPAGSEASVQLRAVNSAGAGAWSAARTATPTVLASSLAVLSARVLGTADGSAANPADSGGGYNVELVLDGDMAGLEIDISKISCSVTSPGFLDGAATSVPREVAVRSRRFWHPTAADPDGGKLFYEAASGGNTVVQLVLMQPVYGGDGNASLAFAEGWATHGGDSSAGGTGTLEIADLGDAPYPVTHAKWATENYRPLLHGPQTFEVCAHAFHAADPEQDGRQRPADGVIFEISNGTATVTQTVTAVTDSTYWDEVDAYLLAVFGTNFGPGGGQPLKVARPGGKMPAQPVFACSLDLAAAGFAIGDAVTVKATALPFIGTNAKVSDGVQDPDFAVQTHRILGTSRRFVTLDPATGSNAPATGVTAEGAASAAILAAMNAAIAAPADHGQRVFEKGGQANGNRQDGLVVMVPAGTANIGVGATRIGTQAAGKACVIENDIVCAEIIPVPGIAPADAVMAASTSGYKLPGRTRIYGMAIDAGDVALPLSSGNIAEFETHATIYAAGDDGTPGSSTSLSTAKLRVHGGSWANLGTGGFGTSTNWRGARVSLPGSSLNSFSDIVLGCDLDGIRLLNDLGASGIGSNHKMRWTTLARSSGPAIFAEYANEMGFSILHCGATSGSTNKMSGDTNTNPAANILLAHLFLINNRFNTFYDDNFSEAPIAGRKWPLEINGCYLPAHNNKGPTFGLNQYAGSSPEKFYRWRSSDPYWHLASCRSNVIAADGNDGFRGGIDSRGEGYRYGYFVEGTSVEPGYPRPLADPDNGDWTVLSDADWAALPSTIALKATQEGDLHVKDLADRDDYATNILSAVVPAGQVPLPFDIWGTAYPASGMTEAGPFRRA